jgi:phosphoribosyl 1,2-cyclic phosphodiesterase
MIDAFMPVTMSSFTAQQLNIPFSSPTLKIRNENETLKVRNWVIRPFETFHDAPGSLGYLIENTVEDIKIAYITDTGYIRYTFPGLNVLIVECNFEEATIEKNREEMADRYLRVRESHMSLERLLSYLSKTDKSQLRKIILVHLSDNNSTESTMTDKVKAATGVDVYAANEGQVISLDRTPF